MNTFTVVFVGVVLLIAVGVLLVSVLRKRPGLRRHHAHTEYEGTKRRSTD